MPSTGKLYHHKMKLRQLTGDSDPDEMLAYLEKRHPLYFLQRKLSKPQIKNLIKKIIFRVSQSQPKKPKPATLAEAPRSTNTATAAAKPSSPSTNDIFTQNKKQHLRNLEKQALEKENKAGTSGGLSSLAGAPSFKAGGSLPSISDDLPGISSSSNKPGKVKINQQFDDDFSAGEDEDDVDSPNEANNEDDEDEGGDFDANELLNMHDYQQKRRMGMGAGLGRDKENPLPSLAGTKMAPAQKPAPKPAAPSL